MIDRDDVLAARSRIGDRLHRTPTFSSRTLGDGVFLKAELFQKTGSFKPRGVLNRLHNLSAEERQLLEQLVYELKMRFVEATRGGVASPEPPRIIIP